MTWRDWWRLLQRLGLGSLARRPDVQTQPDSKAEATVTGALASECGTLEHQQSQFLDARGRMTVQGTLWVRFPPQERAAVRCVAFCPPFRRVPHVDVDQVQGPTATIVVTEALWHGARFEIRLDEGQDCQQERMIQFAYYAEDPREEDPEHATGEVPP